MVDKVDTSRLRGVVNSGYPLNSPRERSILDTHSILDSDHACAGECTGWPEIGIFYKNDLVKNLVDILIMAQVGIHEAKTHLSRLLRRVAAGEVIVIAKSGTPLARLVPIHSRVRRDLGRDSGAVALHEDFDAPLPEDKGQATRP